MSENKQIVFLLLVVTVIGLSGLFLIGGMPSMENACFIGFGDVYVKSYSADLYMNGTLEEHFVYEIKDSGKYRMLYRNWQVPLVYGKRDDVKVLNNPYVELVSISSPLGAQSYVKDYQGEIWINSDSEISSLAEINEAGVYNPARFKSGVYDVNYVFKLYPPLEYDKEYCHLNLKLADEHLPYNKVKITVHDPDGIVSHMFTHSLMDVRKEDDAWIITGVSPKDKVLEIEILLDPSVLDRLDGVTKYVPDVYDRTLAANSKYRFYSLVDKALKLIVFLFPIMLGSIYYTLGREKSFTVPKFLSFVPSNRKPWLINLVFRKDPFDYDENGFYSTILDLHRRKIIEIEPEGLKIRLLKEDEDLEDEYETTVLVFFRLYSINDLFDSSEFTTKIKRLRDRIIAGDFASEKELEDIRFEMNKTMKVPTKKAADEFVMSGKKYTWMIFGIFLLILVVTSFLFSFGIFTSIVLLMQSIPPLFVSSTLFGKWKKNYYKEKLEWDAFKTFLTDFASIKKYAPEDINIWKEWLVYATALGVGKKVVQAMEELNVEIPDVHLASDMPMYFRDTYYLTSPPPKENGGTGDFAESDGFGGGFGEGGGFGGGGGGAR